MPNCNGSLYRFDYLEGTKEKSALLFANPHSQKGRTHHSIQVSLDEGKTWPQKYRLLLDEGRGGGYPSQSRVDERHIALCTRAVDRTWFLRRSRSMSC